jgi:serine/threonine-protein kinase
MAQPSPADVALQGYTIGGKYRLVRLLGAGGMGAVYEAENAWTRRRVAVKLLRPEFVSNAEFVQRFTQEAQSASQIAHANIVDVLDMGQEPSGAMYIVQEYLDGCDLRRLMQDGPMKPSSALAIMVPVIEALGAAHARGIVHRDVKPENIFLAHGRDGEVVPKLIDFGISKVLHEDGESRSRTRTGIAIGTPDYMSPEQARGDTSIDARTDVWAVGAVLYEMLAGRPPFDAPSTNLIITKIITERVAPITEFVPLIPPDVAATVHRALEPQRARRFQDMGSFREAVMACSEYPDELRSRRTTARHGIPLSLAPPAIPSPPNPTGDTIVNAAPLAPVPANVANATTSTIQRSPHAMRSRAPVVLAGALAAVGVVAVLFALRFHRAPPPVTNVPVVTSVHAPPVEPHAPAPQTQPVAEAPIAHTEPPAAANATTGSTPPPTPASHTNAPATHRNNTLPGVPDLRHGPGGRLHTIDHYSVQ